MSDRERLANRRRHEVLEFRHAGFAYIAGVGRFEDGRLAEIFLSAAKVINCKYLLLSGSNNNAA